MRPVVSIWITTGKTGRRGPYGLAEDQQDVVGEPAARVGQEQPDQLSDGGVQVRLGQRLGDHLLTELEEPALPVAGLDQAVGVEQQPVAGPQRDVLADRTGMQAKRRGGLFRRHQLQLRRVGGGLHGRVMTAERQKPRRKRAQDSALNPVIDADKRAFPAADRSHRLHAAVVRPCVPSRTTPVPMDTNLLER
jgi:hypothetical protein